ncbi:MAG: hypothetical protein LBT54_06040 [Bifidobacteriaceae bacterium]|jgi:hypothetical protein|nr:hypothetical protein [Bifidobacteriaceae bacterium]
MSRQFIWWTWRRSAAAGIAVVGLAALAACSGSGGNTAITDDAVTSPAAEFRQVLAVVGLPAEPGGDDAPPLCGETVPMSDGGITACSSDGAFRYELGPVVLGSDAVEEAAGVPAEGEGEIADGVTGGGTVLSVTLTQAGTEQLADLTGEIAGLPEPRDQLALVVDGQVWSAPRIAEPIEVGQLVLAGPFSEPDAAKLTAALTAG